MCKLKKFNNREDNSATLNSEGFDFNELRYMNISLSSVMCDEASMVFSIHYL